MRLVPVQIMLWHDQLLPFQATIPSIPFDPFNPSSSFHQQQQHEEEEFYDKMRKGIPTLDYFIAPSVFKPVFCTFPSILYQDVERFSVGVGGGGNQHENEKDDLCGRVEGGFNSILILG